MNTAAGTTETTAGNDGARPAPIQPGIKPSKRERDKLKAGTPAKPETATEIESAGAADKLIETGAVKEKEPEAGKPENKIGEPAAGEGVGDGKLTFKELAEKLEINPKDLYSMEVPDGLGTGGSVTLGEMKDFYRQNIGNLERLQDLDRGEVQLRTERGKAIRDLDQLVSLLPKDAVSPQYIQAVTEQSRRIAQNELQRLVEVAPEFKDPMGFQNARVAMAATAEAYGLTASEVDNIIDHRWILALHDLSKLRVAKEKAGKLVPDVSGGRSPHGNQQARAKPNGNAGKKGDIQAQTQNVMGLLINHAKGKN